MDSKNLNEQVGDIKIDNLLNDINLQTKIIKILLDPTQHYFREQVFDIMDISFFESNMHRLIVKYVSRYIYKYNSIPNLDTLKVVLKQSVKDEKQYLLLSQLCDEIFNYQMNDTEFVIDIALDFFRKQALKKSLLKAAEEFDSGNFGEISNLINEALKKCEPKSRGHNYLKDLEVRMVKKIRKPVPCLHGLDSKIGGGLSGGELGIVLSPTGGGKSMMLVKFGATALLAGKKVVYYSLELSETSIGNRFDACLNDIHMNMIYEFKYEIEGKIKQIQESGGELFIKEYPTGTATIHTIKNHLSGLYRENGFFPDLILIDYADIMKPLDNFSEKRHSLTSIYEGIRALSMELNIPAWTASQTNRNAVNKDDFDLSSISESLGKAQTADVIVGVARTDADKLAKKAKLMLMKNRNGQDGYSMEMNFDTSKVLIEINSPNDTGILTIDGLDMERRILNG